ncbi:MULTISPECIES: hypothetical protein [Streptomyces]|uniref:Membrane-bound hydrophilic protein n=1 Tax=Streptomyces edwardsiae TaxID=3075527 RepID=A0ABU2PQQ9_9ACTN|nr:hypothetical protein [Streptomyces sp. DSM 41636]MDT0394497.1 hypothetical protein [Streptomyces sp. DSM 41636]
MSADQVRGPRHAAPRKPLFTRFHVPSGKVIALAAMPTAVLMGMGFTPTLAVADGNDGAPTANSLTIDEYQACLEVLKDAEKDAGKDDASASPTPSASASESASPDEEPSDEATDKAPEADKGTDKDTSSSSDSGSDDKDEPAPAPSATAGGDDAAQDEPEPEPSKTDRNLLDDIGDSLKDILTPKDKEAEASPTPSASATGETAEDKAEAAADAAGETAEKATEPAAKDTADDAADKATDAAEDAEETAEEVEEEATETPEATTSPSPSESPAVDPEDCPVATDAEGGVDNKILLPDDPWTLNASSLTLKGASYKGIVEVRTASGATKRVLKYVISNGTDIGDLHQTVQDKQSGATHHVQAAKGSTSTITDGDTVMYTESISGNLLGLIPITFDPEHPPPLDIPLIYFTKVTVKQAGQFGGTLHVPGLRQYITT